MKTLKLLIKTSFFNKINNFLWFDIIKYIFNRRSNKWEWEAWGGAIGSACEEFEDNEGGVLG